ncbi:MAG: Nif3-like dinuclear metal center hexameric protein, partial [Chitinophagia bacterium]|nr:Nif3-like dinuclear metal center hexameric protein [Chitinophagia bacterium]
MQAATIIAAIEAYAPLPYQESYDNSGIQVGNLATEITGILLTLDFTEAVLAEAIARDCNMIIAHHPLLFTAVKRLTGTNAAERIIAVAVKFNLVLYAAHTNADNVLHGVNHKIAQKLGLEQTKVLQPLKGILHKLITYVPAEATEKVMQAMFDAHAGNIGNYSECSFITPGTGTFKPLPDANPTIGTAGGDREYVNENRIELIVEKHRIAPVIKALKDAHPYQEVAYEILPTDNPHPYIGSGLI